MKKIITGSLCICILLLSNCLFAQTIYTIKRTLNFQDAYSIGNNKNLGIKGTTNGTIRVEIVPVDMDTTTFKLPSPVNYTLKGGVLYGAELNNQTSSVFVENPWTISWNQLNCNLFLNEVNGIGQSEYLSCLAENESRSRPSNKYKHVLSRCVQYPVSDNQMGFGTFNNPEIDVYVNVTVTGEASLFDVTFNLPGLGQISGSTFLVSPGGDIDKLFGDDLPMVVSHRGNWEEAGFPENSKQAMLAAESDDGVDWLEIDIEAANIVLTNNNTELVSMDNFVNHDDYPHRLLGGGFHEDLNNGAYTDQTTVYDMDLNVIKLYALNDRFGYSRDEYTDDKGSSESPMDMAEFFTFVKSNITKPINLDIGSKPYLSQRIDNSLTQEIFDSTFVQAIRHVCENDLNDQIIFKYTYTYNEAIWTKVESVLNEYGKTHIFYTPKMISGEDRANYFSDWKAVYLYQQDPIANPMTGNIPAARVATVVGFEIRIKTEDASSPESVQQLHDKLIEATEAGILVGIFSEGTAACEGTWNNVATKKYVDFTQDYRNSIEWLSNLGYGYIITDYPQHLVDYKARSYEKKLSLDGSGDGEFHGHFDMRNATNAALSFDMVLKKSEMGTEQELAVIWGDWDENGTKEILWKFGINKEGKFYASRLLYGTTGTSDTETPDYKGEWDVTFWEPRLAPYGKLDDDDYFFLGVVLEHLETRIHIGIPDGAFDCMYLDYGSKHTVLADYIIDLSSSSESVSSFAKPDFEFHIRKFEYDNFTDPAVNQAFCRTDMFHRAIETYFDLSFTSVTNDNFSFLDDNNPYFLESGTFASLNQQIYTDDELRLGYCELDRTMQATGRKLEEITSQFSPDPTKIYHLDSHGGHRLAATGTSEDAYATTTDDISEDTQWKFVDKQNGYWHLDLATEDQTKTLTRLRTDKTELADMQTSSSTGSWTYFDFELSAIDDAHHLTLPDAPGNNLRLHISDDGVVKMVSEDLATGNESFYITEYGGDGSFVVDPTKSYYIDSYNGQRLAATGTSEDAYVTGTNIRGDEVEWKFVDKNNGYWHLQLAIDESSEDFATKTKKRIRADGSDYADMQSTGSTGVYTYYAIEQSTISGTYHLTLPDGPAKKRLQITADGDVKMVAETIAGETESFYITPVDEYEEDDSNPNLARSGTATQSANQFSDGQGLAIEAIDGDTNGAWGGGSVSNAKAEVTGGSPWWKVELAYNYNIGEINVFNRTDACCVGRLYDFTVFVLNESLDTVYTKSYDYYPDPSITLDAEGIQGRHVGVKSNLTTYSLTLAEVQVFEGDASQQSGTDPSDLIDMTAWKITWPLDENWDDNENGTTYDNRNNDAHEWPDSQGNDLFGAISAPFDEYMYVDGDEVKFKAHVGGATTEGTGYPRTELRQLVGGGVNEWDFDDYQYLEARVRVTSLPSIKPEVVMVQIHGPGTSEPLRIDYNAESEGLHVTENDDTTIPDVLPYSLGEQLLVKVTVDNGDISVVIANESRPLEDPWTDSWTSTDATGYFKIGCYTQSSNVLTDFKSGYTTNPDPSEYGEVAIRDLTLVETYGGSSRIVQDALIDDLTVDEVFTQSLVYPNPSSGKINIQLGSEFADDENLKLHIYDLKGKMMLTREINLNDELIDGVISWDTTESGSKLNTGMYFLSIMGSQHRLVGRIAMDCGCNK